ncbi:solute carrier family 22 member 7-like [Gouania willdenowi]|uniref:Solute carrier family 22 member 7-like n=1 Tax=Gouania willdenowi TaxID=441366 RepID=A0A8C5EQ92_GOUWI|nr:solute carrier family 22 member 7-like [Gouania willdenowi]
MKFDNVLENVNGFGRFQIRTMLLLVISRTTLPFHFLLNNFIGAVPSHHCNINSLDDGGVFSNLSLADRITVSIPLQQDGNPSSCEMFSQPQYHLLLNSSDSTEPMHTVSCSNGWMYDHATIRSTLAGEWDLVCDNKRLNRAVVTIFFIGVMVGAAVFGYLSDRFGRKKALLVSYVTTAFFGFASAFSHNFLMFVSMRFFTGVGLSGISMITYVLCIEWTSISHRSTVGILLSLDWTFFTTVLSLVTYFLRDWRHLIAALTSPLLLAIISWWWLPESARWLANNGNVVDAHFYLNKCAKVNGREEFMTDLTPEILSKVVVTEKNRKYSYVDLVRTPGMRRLALLTGILWLGVACTYYGISLNLVGFGANIYLTQFIFGAIEFPAKAFIFFTCDKIGRRLNQVGMLASTGLCVFISMFIPAGKTTILTTVGALGKMFAEGAFTTAYLYTTELYPTVMRQNGMGHCSFMARIGVSVSPLVLLLEEFSVYLPSIIFCLTAVTAALSAQFLPETTNTRLPETIEDVEERKY